jgi:uncharacterized phiE125 gp8 family phage protein
MGYVLVTPPAIEPVSIDTAKAHLRADWTDDDLTITAQIAAARQRFERGTNRALISQAWRATWSCFPRHHGPIRLQKGPVSEVTAVKYFDADNVQQTLDPSQYYVDLSNEIATIWPADTCWPITYQRSLRIARPDTVTVEFTAGYGEAPANVPELFRQCMLLDLTDWFENRGSLVAGVVSPAAATANGIIEDNKIPLLG